MLPVRPLCSTGVTPLLRSYGPLRLPARAAPWLCIPSGRWGPVTLSPPCRVSQDPRLIYPCALSPTTPEGPAGACSLLPRQCQASSSLADWPPPLSVTRPNRVHLRYGSQVCFPGFRQADHAASLRFRYMYERAIYMVNSFHFTRSARLGLVYQRRQDAENSQRKTKDFLSFIFAIPWRLCALARAGVTSPPVSPYSARRATSAKARSSRGWQWRPSGAYRRSFPAPPARGGSGPFPAWR